MIIWWVVGGFGVQIWITAIVRTDMDYCHRKSMSAVAQAVRHWHLTSYIGFCIQSSPVRSVVDKLPLEQVFVQVLFSLLVLFHCCFIFTHISFGE